MSSADGHLVVDFRSDTVTRPSAAMREVIASAEVGDNVFGDCPTVARLEAMAAEISGKEAALYVPTGKEAQTFGLLLQKKILSKRHDGESCGHALPLLGTRFGSAGGRPKSHPS